MLRESLAAPVRSTDAAGTVFVGSVLVLFLLGLVVGVGVAVTRYPPVVLAAPLALLPWFVLRGYEVRTVESGLEGREAIPSFVRWGGLFRDGLKATLLAVGYLLPSVVLFFGGGVLVGYVDDGVDVPLSDLLAMSLTLGILLAVAVSLLLAAYFHPAGVAALAETGRLRSGLDPRRVWPVAMNGRYALAWFLGSVVTAVGLAIAVPLSAVLVGLPLAFVVRSVTNSLYGRGAAAELRGRDDGSEGGIGTDVPAEVSASSPEADPEVQVGRDVAHGRVGGDVVGDDSPAEDPADEDPLEGAFEWDDTGRLGDSS